MVNIDQTVISDAPHILREILQNKENRFNDVEKARATMMQDSQNASLKLDSDKMVTGREIDRDHSARSDQGSVTGSDEESSFLDQSRVDETEVDDAKSDAEADENESSDIPTETKETKRARVENILTSMQHPPQFADLESMYGINEVRKQKRKQNIPQQHESTAKVRRLDGHPYEDDLWSLGHQLNQLNAMRNYFKQYEEPLPKQMNVNGYGGGMDNIHRLQQAYYANLSQRHAEEMQHRELSQPEKQSPCTSRDKRVTDDHFSIAEHVRETVSANKGLSQGVADLDDKELNELIANLKSKIEEAVSATVDKELAKFFQKRNCYKPKDSQSNGERETHTSQANRPHEQDKKQTTDHSLSHILQMPDRLSHNGFRIPDRHSAFELPKLSGIPELPRPPFPHHPPLGYPPLSFYLPGSLHAPSIYSCPIVPPEQTEALSLVVNTPKKKRTKVTDTRLSPRAARALLHDNGSLAAVYDHERSLITGFNSVNQSGLPTSVAVPNPSLHHSEILNFYKEQSMCNSPTDNDRHTPSSNSPSESSYGYMKGEFFNDSDSYDAHGKQITDTLTPMHLRKAKLMFFYVRYPSSAILKVYFPDVQFNKNNTAQLVKWFSNFREFFYIQMEKYARQAIAEGCKHTEELVVTTDSELYRVLNLHYNRNNQIEVPEHFRISVQSTLREFFVALVANKDSEPSWKKPIYKVIARMDDVLPEYFKSPNWMDQLGDS